MLYKIRISTEGNFLINEHGIKSLDGKLLKCIPDDEHVNEIMVRDREKIEGNAEGDMDEEIEEGIDDYYSSILWTKEVEGERRLATFAPGYKKSSKGFCNLVGDNNGISNIDISFIELNNGAFLHFDVPEIFMCDLYLNNSTMEVLRHIRMGTLNVTLFDSFLSGVSNMSEIYSLVINANKGSKVLGFHVFNSLGINVLSDKECQVSVTIKKGCRVINTEGRRYVNYCLFS